MVVYADYFSHVQAGLCSSLRTLRHVAWTLRRSNGSFNSIARRIRIATFTGWVARPGKERVAVFVPSSSSSSLLLYYFFQFFVCFYLGFHPIHLLTARKEEAGKALLLILPSETSIIGDLEARKVPLSKIDLNPTKQQDIRLALQDECIKDPKRKILAQKV
jgi:hypothetical protein